MVTRTHAKDSDASYERVCEIFERLRKLHLKARDQLLASENTGTGTDERSDFVRKSILDQEEQAAQALADFSCDGEEALLQTWIQYTSLEESERILKQTEFAGDLTPDEIVERKARFDQALIDFYRHLAREVKAPRVEEMFNKLADQAEQLVAQQSWRFREE